MAKHPHPYKVGYGRPPLESRFEPGVSGNPKGRPKGSLNVMTTLNRILREPVVINENGRKRTVTKFEVAVKQLTHQAMTGDHRAMRQVIALVSLEEQQAKMETPQEPALGSTEKKTMQNIMKRFARSGEGKSHA